MSPRAFLVVAALVAAPASAAVKTVPVEYEVGGAKLQGLLAYDDAVKEKRPGILVVHEWWGHNEHARRQATRLAEAGYVGFALDLYGKGKVATHPRDAKAFMEEVTKDPKLVTARFDAAYAFLRKQPQVDPQHMGAVGYCFGGTVALEMARGGADLGAVGTFHAGLAPVSRPAAKGKVKPRILVQTGDADPFVPREQVEAFEREMKAAGAKAEVVSYPQAKHGFTNPDAGKAGMEALAYDPEVDAKSWARLVAFLKHVFPAGS